MCPCLVSYLFNCRRRWVPSSARRFTDSMYVKACTLLRHWNAIFSSPPTNNQEMTESTVLNSERMYAEYRDELEDYVTVTDY